MKKAVILIFALFFISCKSVDKKNFMKASMEVSNMERFITPSFSDSDIGKSFKIYGKIKKSEAGYFLVQKENSRSAVFYYLDVPENLKQECEKYLKKYVYISAVLCENKSFWSKNMNLKDIWEETN